MELLKTYGVMYLEINLIAVILLAIIEIKTRGLSRMVSQRDFANAIQAQMLFFLSDTLYVMMKAGFLPYNKAAVMASKEIYFFSTTLMCFFWFVYFEHIQGSSFVNSPSRILASSALVWVMAVLLIVNLFTGILFYVDENGVYQRGKLFAVQYLLSYIYVFATCFRALVGIFDERRRHIRKTLIYLAIFPVAPAGAGIAQFVFPELPLACAALSLATLVMYLNWTDEMISIDPLTKLGNRKQLAHYYDQWQDQDGADAMYLLMIDANKFKSINDTYGHLQGDAALVRIADAMRQAAQESGRRYNLTRYGGDEFIIMFQGRDDGEVEKLKIRIQEILTALNAAAEAPYELGVCIGFAAAKKTLPLKELIEEADERLYEVKRSLSLQNDR